MYILEGNIGAGKSTFLRMLAHELPYISVALEPKNSWLNQVGGQSLLANFYQNPKRWAYTLESLTMICRVKEYKTEQERAHPFHIVERSIYSGYYCFARNCHENGFLTDIEWHIYQEWFSLLTTDICQVPKGFIYLRVDPAVSYERSKKRNRSAEKNMSLGYLKQIHHHHESFIIEKEDIIPDLLTVPVLILESNADFEHDKAQFEKQCAAVEDFLIHTQAYSSSTNTTYQSAHLAE
jgi:deoxyadenosine/deoxycytidine kinase